MKAAKFLLFTLALPAWAATPDPQHYRLCLNTSASNPTAALIDAETWAKAGGGVPAQHCGAVALVGLKRYAEAGTRLDKLASAKDLPDMSFRTELFDQAGNAWLLAGDGARAVQSFSAALTLSAGDPDLFADMARAQAMRKNWQEVVLDMNAALQIMPHRPDLLVLRASARRALGKYGEARGDLDQALKLKPGDGVALLESGLLRRQMGDVGGARRDFQAALKTSSAPEAKENLDALN
jgi:tetratricopeptide (TPR) repeat protein